MKDDDDTMCYRSKLEAAVKAEREAAEERVVDLFTNMETPYLPDIVAAIRARGQDPMPLFDDWPGGWRK